MNKMAWIIVVVIIAVVAVVGLSNQNHPADRSVVGRDLNRAGDSVSDSMRDVNKKVSNAADQLGTDVRSAARDVKAEVQKSTT